jgi:N-acetylglucosaminyldiphosphoundecaprenol N-acetyl-beta-D-mannosaminyltransferase
VKILGIRVDNFSGDEIETKIKVFLRKKGFKQVVTINPEFIIESRKNEEFRDIINNADLNIADGIGIKFAFWRFGESLKKRLAGIDLMWNIIRIAEKKKAPVFLIANENGMSSWEETAEAIKRSFPKIKIGGMNISPSVCYFNSRERNQIYKIKDYKILFCNFGAPRQEEFVSLLKNANTNIKIAMGAGGSFDFISGKKKRAPMWMRRIGMEWLWRLILQPKRIIRIWNAVVVFPIRVLLNK